MENKQYYIGLDVGTNSVGWAVTDTSYNLLRAKGKDMWGARLFEKANTAAERRTKRTSRRRSEREKARKAMLKELFAEEINKIDPSFFIRLEESKFFLDDRSENNRQRYTLFNDATFTDKDYYSKYKTIFHLRSAIINSDEPFDVRLVFIAILNLFSHRGHFLNASLKGDGDIQGMDVFYNDLVESCENFEIDMPRITDIDNFKNILSQKGKSRTNILEELSKEMSIAKKDKVKYALLKLICGMKIKVGDIYTDEDIQDEDKKKDLGFRESDYEKSSLEVKEIVGDEYFELIERAKAVHDMGLLANIIGNSKYLCEARVDAYDNHHKDLQKIKELLKKYDKKAYNDMFRKMTDKNYSAYVGSVNSNIAKEHRNVDNRTIEDLYEYIKKIALKNIPDDNQDKIEILEKIQTGEFLKKQLTASNGVIPNQLQSRELRAILKKAENYLPFLREKGEKNLTVSEMIIQLFEFQIPYYVGPLDKNPNKDKNSNSWAIIPSSGRILPWNFEEKVNVKDSAEKFIEKMVRKCTYLSQERTLPKQSLLYEKFMVLNEINNIRVNGEKISVETKQKIYNDLFIKGKKVSQKAIKQELISLNIMDKDSVISGIDTMCNASLSSIGKFRGIFDEEINNQSIINIIEDIIFWRTIYNDEKKFVKEKIEEKYEGKIDKDKMKRILGLKFSNWGNLSKSFLELEGADTDTGEVRSIIQSLWETNFNLMELLSSRFTYTQELEKRVKKLEKPLSQWTIEDLDDMYLSSPVKRMIWQSMKIVSEIQTVLGYEPKRIFVEMTRKEGEKVRTKSRKDKLKELYKKIKDDSRQWIKELDAKEESYFRSKKMYLYYLQMGRCMYSGESIDLDKLMDDNLYDIDHIYPRSFVKDDSIDNLVLVKKDINNRKQNDPITPQIQAQCQGFWKVLFDHGFMGNEKYSRLTRKIQEFSDEEKLSFINRQIVETGQATKCMTQILQKSMGEEVDVVFSKANLVSEFRHKFNLFKSRLVNDFHHANDAYLNIVVGNSYFVKFTRNPANFIKDARKNPDNPAYKYHMDRFFERDVKSKSEVAWIGQSEENAGTIAIVKKTMAKNSPLITKKVEEGHGKITNETIVGVKEIIFGRKKVENIDKSSKKPNLKAYRPIKTSDVRLCNIKRYGGRGSIKASGYCLVEYTKKKKTIRSLEAIPVYLGRKCSLSEEKLLEYLKDVLSDGGKVAISDIRICLPFIPSNSLVKIDGYLYYLGGKSNDQIQLFNAYQLKMKKEEIEYIRKIEKAVLLSKFDEIDREKNPILSKEKNIELYEIIQDKIENTVYSKRLSSFEKFLKEAKFKFININIDIQCKVLYNIIFNLANLQEVDLSDIGGTKSKGKCLCSKNITNYTEFKLIQQSITGLYSCEKDLMTI